MSDTDSQFRLISNNQTWAGASDESTVTMSDCVGADKPVTFLAHRVSLLSSMYLFIRAAYVYSILIRFR